MKAVAIMSGGMDSVTLAYYLKQKYKDLHLVSFDYGQRHKKELECAVIQADILKAKHEIIDISGIRPLLKGSALTDSVDVPEGHYEEASMSQTVVPNRNAIMLSIAWGLACSSNADILACGVHSGDHHIYPDCRPYFIQNLNESLRIGTMDHRKENLQLVAPFINHDKTWIAAKGKELGVPFKYTWTCYKGLEKHCGKCGACVERKEAFRDSGGNDPTIYED